MSSSRNHLRPLAISLLVALSLLASGLPATLAEEVKLDSLCSEKQVPLTKISLVRNLIEESRTGQVETCNKYHESLEELDKILSVFEGGAICDLSFVDKIRNYHQKFIDSSSKENKATRDAIPKSLSHFFISLCFQISAECKMTLINNLEYDTKEKITEEDYDEILFLESYGATLLDADEKLSDFDDVLLLNDLTASADIEHETGESKMLVKVKTNKMLRKLVENCNNKFKPFYDKLIMPLIKLSNLGYNYQGELLERELKELKNNELVRRWYNIVQMCEIFRNIEVYEDPDAEVTGDDKRQMLTFISKEEVELLRKKNVKSIEEEIAESESTSAASAVGAVITYEPEPLESGDELWIKDQKDLEKLVKKYKASKSESQRIQHKILKKMIGKVKEALMSGKIFVFANELIRNGAGGSSTTSVNEDMLAMMDEAVEEDEVSKGLAPAGPTDGAVAFGTRSGAKTALDVPKRVKYIRNRTDGTKLSKKFHNWKESFFMSKMTIFMWIIGIVGFFMILSACILALG